MARREEYEAMVRRYFENGSPHAPEPTDLEVYGIVHMIESTVDKERDVFLPLLERYSHALRRIVAIHEGEGGYDNWEDAMLACVDTARKALATE